MVDRRCRGRRTGQESACASAAGEPERSPAGLLLHPQHQLAGHPDGDDGGFLAGDRPACRSGSGSGRSPPAGARPRPAGGGSRSTWRWTRSARCCPARAAASAVSHNAKSSAWSCVMISTCAPRGSISSTCSPSSAWCTVTSAAPSVTPGQPELVDLVRPGIDQVQLHLQPGQDPGQFVADVPDAEDRDHRTGRQRFEQQGDLAAAALPAVLVAGVLVEPGFLRLGLPTAAGWRSAPGPAARRPPRGCRRRRCPRCGRRRPPSWRRRPGGRARGP